ncbi:MAG: AAA family ATPase [Lachnospiraceae bacterium]|nr:AAA family ATPase [Lachnospiraceae bacterium]
MKKAYELQYTQLKNSCFPNDLPFQTTAELEPLEGIIGQERAVKAFEFGLAVKMKGYNIYMSGPSGTGKTTYARCSTEKLAAGEPVPSDWCYVYNFKNPKEPVALSFVAGKGKKFKEDIEEFISLCKKELEKAFQAEDYEEQKYAIIHKFEDLQDSILEEMRTVASEYNFQVKSTKTGIYFLPVVNGELIEDENYDSLSEEDKSRIEKQTQIIQEKADVFMRQVHDFEKECEKQVDELDKKIGTFAIGHHVEALKESYKDNKRVVSYISAIQEDILDHLEKFVENEAEEEDSLAALLPLFGKKPEEDDTPKYSVNLIVDHSQTKGAPVVVTFNPTYSNLMGEMEYDSEFGSLSTDFTKIKGGLFHQANGGYLIVQAHDILAAPHAWEALRRVIKTKEINMDSLRELQGTTTAPTLKPEPIPAQFKVIMIGSEYFYELLNECDEEFDKFFKIRADFDYEMPRNKENILKIAGFIKSFVEREKTLEFDVSAVCAIIEHSNRSASNQEKLSTRFNYLAEILGEAYTWAKLENASVITAEHIHKTVYEKEQRMKLYEEKLDEMLDENVIMIDTTGKKIGQINGLAVLDMGSYAFGTPSRITATTYVGKSGIVNIEKEARMSGNTHDKGVQIITGFLGQTYAQKFPMSLSCRVCFEQNYNGIDGDSASSTELYCILSSLSDLPIRQDLAVTGSVNQKGEIQAIGGVTHKIEGFFNLCKKRGLTKEQGVIIPVSNVKDLVLNDEVVNAVKDGIFHIYPISHINEGIELLMGYPAGEKDEQGEFPLDSVHGKVYAKLKAFAKASDYMKGKQE